MKAARRVVGLSATAGVVAAAALMMGLAGQDQEPLVVPPGPAQGQAWAENDHGQTYGSIADARTPAEEPDLIAVVSNEGDQGYAYKVELDGPIPRNPAEAARMDNAPRTIAVYESDGTTRIGWFTIGDGDDPAPP